MRRSFGRANDFLLTAGVAVLARRESVATDVLRLVGRVLGEGVSARLAGPSSGSAGTTGEVLLLSQGSFFAVVPDLSFLSSGAATAVDVPLGFNDFFSMLVTIVVSRRARLHSIPICESLTQDEKLRV